MAFNKEQRIVIVGQKITNEVRQTAAFLRSKGIRVTCVEFSFFTSEAGTRLLSQEIVVGQELTKPKTVIAGSLPIISQNDFMGSLDENGKSVFERILGFGKQRSMPIHWGTKGFSMNVNLNGTHVAICYGYPPNSVFKQSVYSGLAGAGGMTSKTSVPDHVLKSLRAEAQATRLFVPAGSEVKCMIDHNFSDKELSVILAWFDKVAAAVKEHGLRE